MPSIPMTCSPGADASADGGQLLPSRGRPLTSSQSSGSSLCAEGEGHCCNTAAAAAEPIVCFVAAPQLPSGPLGLPQWLPFGSVEQ
jgi:hypothetical protein